MAINTGRDKAALKSRIATYIKSSQAQKLGVTSQHQAILESNLDSYFKEIQKMDTLIDSVTRQQIPREDLSKFKQYVNYERFFKDLKSGQVKDFKTYMYTMHADYGNIRGDPIEFIRNNTKEFIRFTKASKASGYENGMWKPGDARSYNKFIDEHSSFFLKEAAKLSGLKDVDKLDIHSYPKIRKGEPRVAFEQIKLQSIDDITKKLVVGDYAKSHPKLTKFAQEYNIKPQFESILKNNPNMTISNYLDTINTSLLDHTKSRFSGYFKPKLGFLNRGLSNRFPQEASHVKAKNLTRMGKQFAIGSMFNLPSLNIAPIEYSKFKGNPDFNDPVLEMSNPFQYSKDGAKFIGPDSSNIESALMNLLKSDRPADRPEGTVGPFLYGGKKFTSSFSESLDFIRNHVTPQVEAGAFASGGLIKRVIFGPQRQAKIDAARAKLSDIRESSAERLEELSTDYGSNEFRALEDYKDDYGWDINKYLSTGEWKSWDGKNDPLRRAQLKRHISFLDKATTKHETPSSVLYRGLNHKMVDSLSGVTPGSEIRPNTFLSTTIDPEVEREYALAGKMHIKTHPKVRGYNFMEGYGGDLQGESEFLLGRDTPLRLDDVSYDDEGLPIYNMTHLANGGIVRTNLDKIKSNFANLDLFTKDRLGVLANDNGVINPTDKMMFARDNKIQASRISGPGTGRSDSISTNIPRGSFILPENTARALAKTKSPLVDIKGTMTGGIGDTPVRVSNGELFIPPEEVQEAGGPSLLENLRKATVQDADLSRNESGGLIKGFSSGGQIFGGNTAGFANGGIIPRFGIGGNVLRFLSGTKDIPQPVREISLSAVTGSTQGTITPGMQYAQQRLGDAEGLRLHMGERLASRMGLNPNVAGEDLARGIDIKRSVSVNDKGTEITSFKASINTAAIDVKKFGRTIEDANIGLTGVREDMAAELTKQGGHKIKSKERDISNKPGSRPATKDQHGTTQKTMWGNVGWKAASLSMSSMGVYFSLMGVVNMISMGFQKITASIGDINKAFENVALMKAFGSSLKGFEGVIAGLGMDSESLIDTWKKFTGLQAMLQNMFAKLAVSLFSNGKFMDALSATFTKLMETLQKPEVIDSIATLLTNLANAIPDVVEGFKVFADILGNITSNKELMKVITYLFMFSVLAQPIFSAAAALFTVGESMYLIGKWALQGTIRNVMLATSINTVGNASTSSAGKLLIFGKAAAMAFGQFLILELVLESILSVINLLAGTKLPTPIMGMVLGLTGLGGGGILGFAEGGEVNGPGDSDDDKIPAMLSDGEFVINATAARNIGTKRLFELNKLAGGGSPNPVSIPYEGVGNLSFGHQVTVSNSTRLAQDKANQTSTSMDNTLTRTYNSAGAFDVNIINWDEVGLGGIGENEEGGDGTEDLPVTSEVLQSVGPRGGVGKLGDLHFDFIKPNSIFKSIGDFFRGIGDFFRESFKGISEFLHHVGEDIAKAITDFKTIVGNAAKSLGNFIDTTIIKPVATPISKALSNIDERARQKWGLPSRSSGNTGGSTGGGNQNTRYGRVLGGPGVNAGDLRLNYAGGPSFLSKYIMGNDYSDEYKIRQMQDRVNANPDYYKGARGTARAFWETPTGMGPFSLRGLYDSRDAADIATAFAGYNDIYNPMMYGNATATMQAVAQQAGIEGSINLGQHAALKGAGTIGTKIGAGLVARGGTSAVIGAGAMRVVPGFVAKANPIAAVGQSIMMGVGANTYAEARMAGMSHEEALKNIFGEGIPQELLGGITGSSTGQALADVGFDKEKKDWMHNVFKIGTTGKSHTGDLFETNEDFLNYIKSLDGGEIKLEINSAWDDDTNYKISSLSELDDMYWKESKLSREKSFDDKGVFGSGLRWLSNFGGALVGTGKTAGELIPDFISEQMESGGSNALLMASLGLGPMAAFAVPRLLLGSTTDVYNKEQYSDIENMLLAPDQMRELWSAQQNIYGNGVEFGAPNVELISTIETSSQVQQVTMQEVAANTKDIASILQQMQGTGGNTFYITVQGSNGEEIGREIET